MLNAIFNKRQNESSYPDYFTNNGRTITNKTDIADSFNFFFANIGHKLAAEINPPVNGASIHDCLESRNKNSMFLNPVSEDEIIRVVDKCI